MRFLNKICHSLKVCLFLLLHIFEIYIRKEATVEHRANSFHTTNKIQVFFSRLGPKCLRQFRLQLFCFPKRLDSCAMTRVCQSPVSGHQFTL